jgi:hypothetical protein
LNNSITSETLLGSSGNIPLYIYQGTGGTQVPTPAVIGGNSKLHVGGYQSTLTEQLVVTADSGLGGIKSRNGADALFRGLVLDSGTSATQYALVYLSDRGTDEWLFGKSNSNDFLVQDVVNAKNRLVIPIGSPNLQTWRLSGHLATALVSGDFGNSGWGTSPTFAVTRGTDMAAQVTMTCGTTPSANPTITLTFKDGTWSTIPVVVACRADSAVAPTTAYWAVTAVSATAVTFTFVGTPTAGNVYGLAFHCLGT